MPDEFVYEISQAGLVKSIFNQWLEIFYIHRNSSPEI